MSAYDNLPPEYRERAQALIERIFAADSRLDLDGFMALLDANITLRIGSQPALQGHNVVREVIAGLFAGQRHGIVHRLLQTWGSPGMLVYQAEATFHLKDGRDIALPYVNVLGIAQSGLIGDYRIYIDLSPLRA